MDKEIESELDNAWRNLTDEQKARIERRYRFSKSMGISCIASSLGLTRSYVQSYIRLLNRERG